MAKHVIDARTRSFAAPSVVFALLADGRTWPVWGAWTRFDLEQSAPDGGEGVGAVRVFTSRVFGRTVVSRERVLDVVPGRSLSYGLLSGLPLRGYVGRVEVEPDGDGSVVHWHSEFDCAAGGAGWLYRAVLQRFITDAARRVAGYAERHLE